MYEDTETTMAGFGDLLAVWGPRILGALLILVAAWFIGKLVKGALAKGVDKMPALRHHNEGRDPKSTAGSKLGDVALWLILLFGVVAALNVLNLGGVVTPLNAMLADFLSFIPHIVGALLIFFIGFIVATLAKRLVTAALQAAGVDERLSKLGFAKASGAGTGLSSALGTLVFVLIIIPVSIAALNTLQIEAISTPAIAVLNTILSAIPNVLAAAIVLAIGWVIGRFAAGVVEKVLPATGFDNSIKSLGGFSSMGGKSAPTPPPAYETTPTMAADASPTVGMVPGAAPIAGMESSSGGSAAQAVAPPKPNTPSKIVANIVMFAIVAFSAIEAARLLQFGAFAEMIENIVGLAGRVIVGGLIITAAVLIADMLSNAIDKGTQGADKFASTIVKWATIALGTAMGLRFMGIADEIVILAFGLILGSAAVAAALAFGLGGRDAAGRLTSRWVEKAQAKAATAGGPQAAREDGGSEPRTIPGQAPDPRFQ